MNKIDFNHHQSAHCENGVASNILKFNGVDINEPMIFGIGSGLFYICIPFLKVNQAPAISYRPMPGFIFSRASKRMNIEIKRERFSTIDKSFDALDRNIDKGIATGLQVGVYHLPYFPDEYRFHFNAHNLVVYGKQGNEYLISDPVMETTSVLTREELAKVRFAKGVFAPKGHMYYPTHFPAEIDFPKAIISGIKKTTSEMLAPVPFVGTNGIKYVAKKIPGWAKKLGTKKTNHYLAQIIRMQEEIGTGGGGFRFIYAAFLQQAGTLMDKNEFLELSQEMTLIGDDWRDFALKASRICKNRDNDENAYENLSQMMLKIADKEKQFFIDLKKSI
ncbi:MAG TPA: BtrH N-terminal domain-containing protein [Brumimicrobium sp.]|nr:BtrH N-terminal domain-containing protein [Brumimicrobium sp.]